MNPGHRRAGLVATGALSLVATMTACSQVSPSQDRSQSLTERIANASVDPSQGGVAYPFAEMQQGGWLEMKMLREHLVREASPKSQRWIVVFSQQGQLLGQWAIQGVAFDPNSQMTTPKIATCTPNTGGSGCGAVVDAPGDNGTYGPEAGVLDFFTSTGVEVKIGGSPIWFQSDAPLGLSQPPVITYNANSAPSFNGGGVKVGQ
jgi:hypothetical protein